MWSVVSYVEVYTDSQRMEPPWVDYPLTESEINLANIGNDAVRVGFYLTSEDAHRYTHVHFYWIGTLEDGGTVPHSEMRELAGTKAYYFEIPNAVVAAIARGVQLSITYSIASTAVPPFELSSCDCHRRDQAMVGPQRGGRVRWAD